MEDRHQWKYYGKCSCKPNITHKIVPNEVLGGKITELATNITTYFMYAQHDVVGNEYLLLDLLIDCQIDDKVISLKDQEFWQICCLWKACSTSWAKMSNLKESYPL